MSPFHFSSNSLFFAAAVFRKSSRLLRILSVFAVLCAVAAAANRSTYIDYDEYWVSPPTARGVALDTTHQQVFIVCAGLDRVEARSTVDYHLIRSIPFAAANSIDISPDRSTVVVGVGAHMIFLNTTTYSKINDVAVPNMALGIQAVLYLANGNMMVRGVDGDSTNGGSTAFWNAATNQFSFTAPGTTTPYQPNGPMARSGDYSRVILGDATTSGSLQIIDATTGAVLWTGGYGGYIYSLAINNDGSKFAACVDPAGYSPSLVILDSSFDEIYQDQMGCQGMVFSADGTKLYRRRCGQLDQLYASSGYDHLCSNQPG